MTARDELATVMEAAYNLNPGMGSFELLAHAVLAAGYRKPRMITTTEEVDALPHKSVVLTKFGDAVTIYRSRRIPAKCYHFLTADDRTATVIHEPQESK